MHEIVSAILRRVIGRLWWDDLPERVGECGVLLTILSFIGSASTLGLVCGGVIGLLLCDNRADIPTYALNGCCAFGFVSLFIIAATLFIDPDRLT